MEKQLLLPKHAAAQAPFQRYAPRDNSAFPSSLQGKRILLCTESFGPVNGVSRTTLMLVEHLRAHGALVAVVAPLNHTKHNTFAPPSGSSRAAKGQGKSAGGAGTTKKKNTQDQDQSDGSFVEVRLHGYPLPFNPELSVVYPVRVSALFARTFGADNPPDLIYLASPASLGFQVMLQVRQQPREKRVPIICNFQTDLSGYCKILFPSPLSSVAVYALALVQSFLFRHESVKTIFYPSRFVRRYLEAQGVHGDKMEILRRGVNTELFCPERRSAALRREIAPDGEIILLCVSRVAGEKGFDFLAGVTKELDARGLRFKLYVVGGNRNQDVERQVHGLFEPLRGQGKVIFAGFKTGEELATAYAAGDIFLHCSVTETFGLVVLESMASGVPVVARDEGGPSDIIEEGQYGHLVSPDDMDGFADKVMRLANDRGLREDMARRAREMACNATWEKINNQVAWRMADTIEEREQELLAAAAAAAADELNGMAAVVRPEVALAASEFVPLYIKSKNLNDSTMEVLQSRIVDAKLAGGIGVVMACWVFTGLYLVFTEIALWTKGRLFGGWGGS